LHLEAHGLINFVENKTMKYFSFLLLLVVSLFNYAQNAPFQIAIEPLNIPNLGGIHSFAYGQDNGKWLVIGGRLDGLHRRQPFAAFDQAGHNTQLFVVDPVAQQVWAAPMTSLSTGLQEQLKSTNMQFTQVGNYLYITGGYGHSVTQNNHYTFPNLTAVHVQETIDAIINASSFTSYFRQITDPKFQVTGGYLERINNTFYLVGGQKFIGLYNPMGPTSGPGFFQEYTDAIRRFNIVDDGINITVTHLPEWTDSLNLHRRDYNVSPQILPTGEEGLTAFSGVFQPVLDLPWLNSVNIDSTNYQVNNSFTQYYNHYHCAHFPIYSASANEMHTIFFGGIAQYYDNNGTLVQDNDVPFVKTIARVSRNAAGVMSEHKLPIEMPSLLGAGSEFIPIQDIPSYGNGVFKLDNITADSTLLGYIYGGISSTGLNIFFTNTGTQSSASSQIFKVYLIKNALGLDEINPHSVGTLKLKVYPNPNDGVFKVEYNLTQASDVRITLISVDGKVVEDVVLKNQSAGLNTYEEKSRKLRYIGTYLLKVQTNYESATQQIVIKE
jgi:Secretion system C-terminal sorting domain